MKKLILAAVIMSIMATVAAGADATAPAATGGALAWFSDNKVAVIAAALAISELLALVPGLKGNGILDSIIKILKVVSGKAGQ